MGYGSFLARKRDWLSEEQFRRILKLINDMELTLWHPIMDNHGLVQAANKKAHDKRGGNLCAPVPKGEIGLCGYINDLKHDDIPPSMNEYKALVQQYPRGGNGIDMHCHDVGLEDPSTVAGDAFKSAGQAAPEKSKSGEPAAVATNYEEWIKAE
jgi:3-dehydroquinate synthase